MTNTAEQTTPNPQATVDKLGLKVSAVFVPFSQSRNKGEENPSLNWKVTLYTLSPLDGQQRDILTTDYMAGSAHCHSYKQNWGPDRDTDLKVRWECETGGRTLRVVSTGRGLDVVGTVCGAASKVQPKALDVIYSLVLDSDVLDAGTFEEWAANYGYDTDSRASEKIYQACLEIALKLRRGIGDAGLSELREAFQDY